jgi:hypothetical protein
MRHMPLVKLVLLSLLGAALIHFAITACNSIAGAPTDGSTRDAIAAPSSCSTWQVSYYFSRAKLSTVQEGLGTTVTVAAGWEPMSVLPYAEGSVVTVRKCLN